MSGGMDRAVQMGARTITVPAGITNLVAMPVLPGTISVLIQNLSGATCFIMNGPTAVGATLGPAEGASAFAAGNYYQILQPIAIYGCPQTYFASGVTAILNVLYTRHSVLLDT